MANCITTYKACMEALYAEYIAALGVNPTNAKVLERKVIQMDTINALYWSADAGADEADKTTQCARLAALFLGDSCLTASLGEGGARIDTGTFTNADLDGSFYLDITHSLATTDIASVAVKDPAGLLETVDPVTIIDSNTVRIAFGGAIGAGTWTWIVSGLPTS